MGGYVEVQFGLDISHHQDARLDLARARREGISFIIIKATEGATWNDPEFAANLVEARAAGLLVAAYHYQRPDDVSRQRDNVANSVPLDVPVILDVESGSGSLSITRDLISALRNLGYRVPLLYLPRWYWQQIGSPSLLGLPPLWSSRYPDNVIGTLADEWADVPTHYWNGYGGLPVAVLQFTSSVAIAGFSPIDANAFRGSLAELTTLLIGSSPEDDMTPYELGALERASLRANAMMKMIQQVDEPLSELNPDGTPARLQERNELADRIIALESAVSDLRNMMTTIVNAGLKLGASGEIIIKPA